MKLCVINGSPKGPNSITLQTVLYLQKHYPQHQFEILHIGQKSRYYKTHFDELKAPLESADALLFIYPVYTFLAPYQVHLFIEQLKEANFNIADKFVSQISTSKHFYDVTAHKYIEENCYDLNLKFIPGLSADMDDLLSDKGQKEALQFFDEFMYKTQHNIYSARPVQFTPPPLIDYHAQLNSVDKTKNKDVVIVTNVSKEDTSLQEMIKDFQNVFPYQTRIINIREFKFDGGCLGCLNCAVSEKCIYKDGFDSFLRNEIQNADAIVYAYTIENHYTHSSFKCYDDRQFCNGHRTVTMGMPVAYIINGHYDFEFNVQTLVEARSQVGGVTLCGVATNQSEPALQLTQLAQSLDYALEHKVVRPANFYGVGGSKIFRDLIYLMQGMMKADHLFYKKHGFYDFPTNNKFKVLKMKILGSIITHPSVQKKLKGQLSKHMLAPYEKVIKEN
ncbi:MAG: NAD(P)H-dependent oxidoreductase [Erysipelotrichaceae bacterium]